MRIVRRGNRGQFIIIAALLIAIMIVSISTTMYGAATYYRHERWEEYLTIIDNVELGSRRVVEISLADYTRNNCTDGTILRENLNRWSNDTKKTYAGFGVIVSCSDIELSDEDDWYQNESFSTANTTITIDITSTGLKGYKFTAPILLRMSIFDTLWDVDEEELVVYLDINKEDLTPVTNLRKNNFLVEIFVDGSYLPGDFTLEYYYDEDGSFVYKITCENVTTQPSSVSVTAIDTRNIKVIANSTVTP